MHSYSSVPIQYTKFEVPSFTNYKDMICKILKMGHVTQTTPLHCRLGFDTVYLQAKLDNSSFNRSRDIIGGDKI